MAPEQIRMARDVDARADVWSLGIVLFELMTGTLPFAGSTSSALLAAISADKAAPLRSRLPNAPGALDQLIRRCLDKTPSRRPRNAAELAGQLAQFATRPPEGSLATVTKSEPRRRPSRLVYLFGAALTGALVLGAMSFGGSPPISAVRGAPAVATRIANGVLPLRATTDEPPTASAPPLAPPAPALVKPSVSRRALTKSSAPRARGDLESATSERK
jgi:serine/threonine-protein kinase